MAINITIDGECNAQMHCTAEMIQCQLNATHPWLVQLSLFFLSMLLFWLQVAESCNAAFLPTELMLAQSLTTLAVNLNGRLQSLIYTSSHPRSK